MTKKKILVLDDDRAILELLKFRISRRGFAVQVAENPRQFYDQAFSLNPDLLILDIWLKTVLGTDLYNDLLEIGFNADIPVIFVTGLSDTEIAKSVPQEGRYALFSKPFDFHELLKEIRRLTQDPQGVPRG